MSSLLEKIAAMSTVAALVIAVPTLYIGGKQFYEDIKKSQVQSTLGYVTRYKTDPVNSDRTFINTKLLLPEAKAIYDGDHKDFANKVHIFDQKQDLDGHFVNMIGFYDELYICIERDVCDLRTALILLSKDIRSDRVWIKSEIESLRSESVLDKGFGCGFMALSDVAKAYLNRPPAGKHWSLPPLAKCPALDEDAD